MCDEKKPLTAEQEIRLLNNHWMNERRLVSMLMSVLTPTQVLEMLSKFEPGPNATLADQYTYWTLKRLECDNALESLHVLMRSEV
jgi:hypothetical protein